MIRLANPGSDINQLVKIYKTLFSQLSDFDTFNLDNIADIMTSSRMASSKGYIGEEALKRSYAIQDMSRNPLYNQAKMYAEIYRLLGWIISDENASLSFKFTLLGHHVAIAEDNTLKVVNQSFLGINFPNNNVNVKFTNSSAPFFSILEFSKALDSLIHRDEIIIGPLNMKNSFDNDELESLTNYIKKIRKKEENHSIDSALKLASKINSISINTMQNYTRIIISELKYSNWYVPTSVGKKVFLKLTENGIETLEKIQNQFYITYSDIKDKDPDLISSLCRWGFINFLKDSNFDVAEELKTLEFERNLVLKHFNTDNIFFNPFQVLSSEELNKYFPEANIADTNGTLEFNPGDNTNLYTSKIEVFKISSSVSKKLVSKNKNETKLKKVLLENKNNINDSIKQLIPQIEKMKQKEFYPLVADLLAITFNTDIRLPQAGVNNERFDIIIDSPDSSIPIEVKSPTEELMLSTKSVRQALENKIILLSRKHYLTTESMTSMVIGFNIPNERSDVFRLIDDIKKVYNFNISLLDIHTLLKTALSCLKNDKTYSIQTLENAQGVLYFENI